MIIKDNDIRKMLEWLEMSKFGREEHIETHESLIKLRGADKTYEEGLKSAKKDVEELKGLIEILKEYREFSFKHESRIRFSREIKEEMEKRKRR